jgi:hypothetical protein
MAMVFFREPWYPRRNTYLFSYEVPEFRILESEFQFSDSPDIGIQKYFPTVIFRIQNEIGIPLTMGVPEIGTKNWNSQPSNKPGRVNTQVDFPINGFVPIRGFDNVETTVEYDLFAAICHKESRDKTSGHYTAQFNIKDSNNHWIEYNDADFESNNFINQKNKTKAKIKYYPLVYILFYIKKSDAVSPEIGLQVQVNDGISQSLTGDHNNEQNQVDVVSSNNQQDMWVNENSIQVNGTNICNQGVLEENIRITNTDRSSDNNNTNVNPESNKRIRQSIC